MDFLIVGLGNPGTQYEQTRHNIGFLVLDALAGKVGASFTPSRFGWHAEGKVKNKRFAMLKPDTFMNLSGKAAKHWLTHYKLQTTQMLVVTDDLALATGSLRIRTAGSDGGHNGLKSLTEVLATQEYPRLRFGVGKDFPKGKQVDYVLANWPAEDWELVEEKIALSLEAIITFILEGPGRAMTAYNRG